VERLKSLNQAFMKSIVISSQKGGSAKSTLATLLSVEAERAGDGPAWIVDTDQQGTLTRWHERREAETPLLAALPFTSLRAGLASLAEKHGAAFCFIDTAPAISGQSASLIDLADLVLIPVQPSPGDLWAVADTIEIVKAAGKPFRFVVTKAKAHANITAEAVAALSNHGPVAASFIADRVAYAAALGSGQTAPELQPKGSAALETTKLWQEVKSCFNENRKYLKKTAHG
jgi:chromosome partitioning protein